VGRHWKADGDIARIIPARERGDWTRPEDYTARRRSWPVAAIVLIVLLAAACLGLAVGLYQGADPGTDGNAWAVEGNAAAAEAP
jgi:hypothetical protein